MARFLGLAFVGVIAVALLHCAVEATVHVVGDNQGWKIPQPANAYETWISGKTFMVGDILTFNFATNEHDVVEVPKESYDACTGSNPIGQVITNGPANVTLQSAGTKYYICTIGQHCANGQKLSITVSSATAGPPTSGPSASMVPPTTPSGGSGPTPDSSSPVALSGALLSLFAVIVGLLF